MRARGAARATIAALLLAAPAAAARLPVRAYASADGLGHDHVLCVRPDSRGFLWVCTAQGLSRFDGRRFVTYGTADGLTELYVNDFLETRAGEYWTATNGAGVFRFDPGGGRAPEAAFTRHAVGGASASNRVNVLREDAAGALWAGTDEGLYRRAPGGAGFERVDLPGAGTPPQVSALARDPGGALWVATTAGVYRVEGREAVRLPAQVSAPQALMVDARGRLWMGHAGGLAIHGGAAGPGGPGDRPPVAGAVTALQRLGDGRLFIGLRHGGLGVWDGAHLALYGRSHGLSDDSITTLAEDASGTLWIGTETGGLLRLARNGFVSLDASDGLGHERVVSIFETQKGELCVLTAMHFFNRYHGGRFHALRPRLEGAPSIRSEHKAIQDAQGGWWIATPHGLARFARAPGLDDLARARPLAVYTTRDGLPDDNVAWPFEDSRGDIWVAYARQAGLSRWQRSGGTFRHYDAADGLPGENRPVAFAEDAAGTVWVGFREGGLARYRGGRFEYFGAAAGLPLFNTRALHRDARGRLWAATTGGGVLRVEAPEAETPRFVRLTTADGLSSDHVRTIAEDAGGHLYLGGTRGVDRLDARTGAVVHYTTADGLAQNEVQSAFGDASGALWFGTMRGVSRFVPGPGGPELKAPVLIGGVAVAGSPLALSRLGQRAVSEFEVPKTGDTIRIEYFALALAGGTVRFQYRLAGGDWSPPTSQDSVEYAALAPGRYRFEVRAAGGAADPASVNFVVPRPLWQRWWFLALAGTAVAGLAYRLHRYRLQRQLEMEHVRTRIASDLHDDIGSSLTHIAILSEVAARGLGAQQPETKEMLAGIATASREAVGSMSDIVWAIDPERDHLDDLVHRMRRFASDVFTARDLEFRFDGGAPADVPLGADLRRHVFLVFKECVNNAARHSGCRAVEASVRVEDHALVVTLRDDGRGFDPQAAANGHGLGSMRSRAERLGGTLAVTSGAGDGTAVVLRVPLRG